MAKIRINLGKARAIFEQIDSDDYTDEEKACAIFMVNNMETKNSVTKESMTKVINWLWGLLWELEDMHKVAEGEEHDGTDRPE